MKYLLKYSIRALPEYFWMLDSSMKLYYNSVLVNMLDIMILFQICWLFKRESLRKGRRNRCLEGWRRVFRSQDGWIERSATYYICSWRRNFLERQSSDQGNKKKNTSEKQIFFILCNNLLLFVIQRFFYI